MFTLNELKLYAILNNIIILPNDTIDTLLDRILKHNKSIKSKINTDNPKITTK